ncbi:hypothetical protein IE81DRAFT_350576 [Ceraceosorus guamensis]|uniref:Uncharacterized protein n=1 Tax=Ceraceosorus guamensis TaxID=1522189 RepID=A0A316VPI5_9BASI|nr:hypothetical protein IE81DRAFT_350576 [Ceraceosorus guamensis]PWN38988.1 hypothetical protein IE81DRAFT_350576 [Ceraceosorus guamensis]
MIAHCKLPALIALLSCFAATHQVKAQLQRKGLKGELPQCPSAGYQGFRNIVQGPSGVDIFASEQTLLTACYDAGGAMVPHDMGDKDAQPIVYPFWKCLDRSDRDFTCKAFAKLNENVANGQPVWVMTTFEEPQQHDGISKPPPHPVY